MNTRHGHMVVQSSSWQFEAQRGQKLSILMMTHGYSTVPLTAPRNIHSGTASSCAGLYGTHQHPHLTGAEN